MSTSFGKCVECGGYQALDEESYLFCPYKCEHCKKIDTVERVLTSEMLKLLNHYEFVVNAHKRHKIETRKCPEMNMKDMVK